ncbi:alkaline phosphatase [Solimonas sp. K1W22B-7]|nr:alkaline phosphatase [Solimonas sp. K1W22B-7]
MKQAGGAGLGLGAAGLAGCGDSDSRGGSGELTPGQVPPANFDFPTGSLLPFAHGVASGDPLADRVILWTRVTELAPRSGGVPVTWRIASDPLMRNVLRSGTQQAIAARDWTVKVDVTGLAPATTYYYRFEALGAYSITGRTRTAPAAAVSELRVAVLACSSYWSSYWSGLGHLAARDDLDLVIHCGDYIYDFVDEDETVRARRGRADTADVDYRDWLNLAEIRRRYALWRSDPNLLRAHQQHPWFIVWDNHDIDEGFGNELPTGIDGSTSTATLADTTRAFWEWTPSRPVLADGSGRFLRVEDGRYPEPPAPLLVYRKLPYGPLLDLYGVDTQIYLPGHGLEADASHLPEGAPSLFGRRQFEWLTADMLDSAQRGVTWRLLNNQTWIGPADTPDLIEGVPLPKLGISRWTDYSAERAALFQYLRGANPAETRVRNNVFVSGDVHGNWASDLVETSTVLPPGLGLALPNTRPGSTPENLLAGWGRALTGNLPGVNLRGASVGVEFAPSSMGRGGADELIANALGSGAAPLLNVAGARAVELALLVGNNNCRFVEWVDHGYGIVSLNAERAIFEWWWQDKLTPDAPDVLGYQMVTFTQENATALPPRFQDQIDSVSAHGMSVAATVGERVSAAAPEGMLLES